MGEVPAKTKADFVNKAGSMEALPWPPRANSSSRAALDVARSRSASATQPSPSTVVLSPGRIAAPGAPARAADAIAAPGAAARAADAAAPAAESPLARLDRAHAAGTTPSDASRTPAVAPTASEASRPAVAERSEDDVEGLRREVHRLRSDLAQAQLKLREAGGKLEEWQTLVEDALHTAVFSAEASERYRLHASMMIRTALTELPQVTRLKYVRCSFPCVRRESPRLRLAKYTSLSSSEWEVNFSPSWSVDVLVEGYHYLYFELAVRVSSVSVKGLIAADFVLPLGLGGVRLGFVHKPKLAMDLESTVNIGLVPVPIQDQIADIVRSLIDDWLVQNLVTPNLMLFKPDPIAPPARAGDGAPKDGSAPIDDEVERAVLAALTHRLTNGSD